MLFNSFNFVLLAIVTLSLYYIPVLKRFQVFILIAASFGFYAFDRPLVWLLPILFSVAINLIASYLVCYGNNRYSRIYAATGVLINLAILIDCKYFRGIPMPIGLSFITFQAISLLVDTFRRDRIDLYKNLISISPYNQAVNVLFYIAFFPKLTAGPIVKARDFFPQIKTKYYADIEWGYIFKTLILGYFLKMVIADNLKESTYWIAYPQFLSLSSTNLFFLTLGYSIQLFADFAGYSLIAIGLAALFGYRLPDNFKFPYISKSFSEFWTRWHISLSSFLKEYLYIPLGGNKKGTFRTYVNLMIVMFLGGVWHGTTWNFAVWGVCHGVFLTTERALRGWISLPDNWLVNVLQTFLVFLCVSFAWLLFCLTDFSHTVKYFQALFNNAGSRIDAQGIIYILIYSVPVICYHIYYLYKYNNPLTRLAKLEYVTYGVMLFLIITNSGSSTRFIYFQF